MDFEKISRFIPGRAKSRPGNLGFSDTQITYIEGFAELSRIDDDQSDPVDPFISLEAAQIKAELQERGALDLNQPKEWYIFALSSQWGISYIRTHLEEEGTDIESFHKLDEYVFDLLAALAPQVIRDRFDF